MKAGGIGARRRPSAVHPHLPGRTMADDGFLLIPDNVLGAHAGEEIVRMVVLADMIEAKPPIFALAQPPPWARDGTIFVGLEPDVAFSRPWPALTGRSGPPYADALGRPELIPAKLTKAFAHTRLAGE